MMFNLKSAKFRQIEEFLGKQVVLVDNVLYYLKPVNIVTLEKTLNFKWEEQRDKMFFISAKQPKDEPLSKDLMEELILKMDYEPREIAALHFYEQIQILLFSEIKNIWGDRSLIVTVMGHVDHGKTTLLDKIRNSNLTMGEHGQITQKIGGYQIEYQKNKITFIDTPGHQLFANMRAQGVKITDLIVLVVAGNEGVKQQTIEAINHAQAAKVPVIVFINKMDLPLSNFAQVKEQLDNYKLTHHLFNRRNLYLQGSCLQQQSIRQLLQTLCDAKNKLPLKVNFNCLVKAVVLDASINNQGPQATIIIQKGTLKPKDPIIVEGVFGRVKTIINDHKKSITEALPGMCVVVSGLNGPVRTGTLLFAFPDFKLVANLASQFNKENVKPRDTLTMKDRFVFWNKNRQSEINLIIKVDSKGIEQVLQNQIPSLENEKNVCFKLNILHLGLGAVTLNDLNLAIASDAIMIAFNLKNSSFIVDKVRQNNLRFHQFNILSHLFDYLNKLKQGQAVDQITEKIIGTARILKLFSHSKFGIIAGCVVEKGIIKMGEERFRVSRNKKIIATNLKIKSLKHEKETIKLAVLKQEFGIIFDNFFDLKIDDQIEQFSMTASDEK